MYHLASSVIRLGSEAFRWAAPMYLQRIASTWAVVGAVVTTDASPGECTSIHQHASGETVCDFETS